jgi:hypothetical protein
VEELLPALKVNADADVKENIRLRIAIGIRLMRAVWDRKVIQSWICSLACMASAPSGVDAQPSRLCLLAIPMHQRS